MWPSSWGTWLLADDQRALGGMDAVLDLLFSGHLAFWMLEISTVVFIIYSFEYFLSGHMFPLGFMPMLFKRFEILAFSL